MLRAHQALAAFQPVLLENQNGLMRSSGRVTHHSRNGTSMWLSPHDRSPHLYLPPEYRKLLALAAPLKFVTTLAASLH